MPAKAIAVANASPQKLFYVVANVIMYRASDKRYLLLKRNADAKTHPNKWCVPGGKIEWSDLDLVHPTRYNGEVLDFENILEKVLAREVKEETGIHFSLPLTYINSVAYVRSDGVPSVLIKFLAACLAGEIKLEKSFSQYAWVSTAEIKNYDCIRGIPEELALADTKIH